MLLLLLGYGSITEQPIQGSGNLVIIKAEKNRTVKAQAIETIQAEKEDTITGR